MAADVIASLVAAAGCALLIVGFGMAWLPLGFIVFGVVLCAIAVGYVRNKEAEAE